MVPRPLAIALALCSLGVTPPLSAQLRQAESVAPGNLASPAPAHRRVGVTMPLELTQRGVPASGRGMLLGGLVGGAAGAGVGYLAAGGRGGDLGPQIVGAGVGAAVGVPLGVHLGNHGRGHAAATMGAGFAVGAGVTLLGVLANAPYRLILGGAPLIALFTSMAVEATTARTR